MARLTAEEPIVVVTAPGVHWPKVVTTGTCGCPSVYSETGRTDTTHEAGVETAGVEITGVETVATVVGTLLEETALETAGVEVAEGVT